MGLIFSIVWNVMKPDSFKTAAKTRPLLLSQFVEKSKRAYKDKCSQQVTNRKVKCI